MKITQVSRCAKCLRFGLSPVWAKALPHLHWRGICLTCRGSETVDALDGSDTNLETWLAELYPKMRFADFAQLFQTLRESGLDFDWAIFLPHYQMRFTEDFLRAIDQWLSLPSEFQTWSRDKELSVGDLLPLLALKNDVALKNNHERFYFLQALLARLAQHNPSKQEGTRALEWIIDLYLISPPRFQQALQSDEGPSAAKVLLSTDLSWAEFFVRLEVWRYPLASSQKKKIEELAKSLPWPKRAQVKAGRQGDRSGFEVKIFIRDSQDLRSQVKGFSAVAEQLEKREGEKRPGGEVQMLIETQNAETSRNAILAAETSGSPNV